MKCSTATNNHHVQNFYSQSMKICGLDRDIIFSEDKAKERNTEHAGKLRTAIASKVFELNLIHEIRFVKNGMKMSLKKGTTWAEILSTIKKVIKEAGKTYEYDIVFMGEKVKTAA